MDKTRYAIEILYFKIRISTRLSYIAVVFHKRGCKGDGKVDFTRLF